MPACPGHVNLVPGHIHFCGYVPDWAGNFSICACTYFTSNIHNLYRACIDIGWAHENFGRACKFLGPCSQWVNQMLNVNPCMELTQPSYLCIIMEIPNLKICFLYWNRTQDYEICMENLHDSEFPCWAKIRCTSMYLTHWDRVTHMHWFR